MRHDGAMRNEGGSHHVVGDGHAIKAKRRAEREQDPNGQPADRLEDPPGQEALIHEGRAEADDYQRPGVGVVPRVLPGIGRGRRRHVSGEADRRLQRRAPGEVKRGGHGDQDEREVVEQRRHLVDLRHPELPATALSASSPTANGRSATRPSARSRSLPSGPRAGASPSPNGGTPSTGSG